MQQIQHNDDLDFVKGIGIILVVLGHCFTTAIVAEYSAIALFKSIIYTVHMPLFFIVSGYLQGLRTYKIEQFRKFAFNQTKKLMLPYLIWSIVLYLFYFVLSRMTVFTIPEEITLNPIYMILDILQFKVVTGNALWFVYILYLISVVSYFTHNFINKKSINILFVLSVTFIGFAANTFLTDDLFVIRRFAVMWIYYEIGVFIGKYIKDIDFKANIYLNIAFVGLYVLFYFGKIYSSGVLSKTLSVLCALVGVFIIYSLSKYDKSRFYRLFSYIGKRTLYIYYLHNPYIVLILVTGLHTFAGINILISITVSFALGCIIPLIIGKLAVTRIKGASFIFGGRVQATE